MAAHGRALITASQIEQSLLLVRGQKVLLDSTLAGLYGVQTKVLVQAVKRNRERFPSDFLFELSKQEVANLRSQFVTSSWGGRRYSPFAFTEQGVAMLSSVLNSPQAVAMSVYVVRAFVSMREQLAANSAILKRLAEIDKALLEHDSALRDIYDKLLPLVQPLPDPPKRRIGFLVGE